MHTSTTSLGHLTPWSANDLQQATGGYWYQDKKPSELLKRILTDSRHAEQGDIFLALKGERFDGHTFISQVASHGCTVVIVSEPVAEVDNIFQLVVSDTRIALGHLGTFRRQSCQKLQVIALTGSSGKTTTKEMLSSILNGVAPTLVTRGNLNNDLGVPMMLLELLPEHRYAVMELGANHQGEIDYTSNLVRPDVAGILNIGTAHLGEFGGREGICTAKSEIYNHLSETGIAVVPAQDDFTVNILNTTQHLETLSFGMGGDVFATDIQLEAQQSIFCLHTPEGTADVCLPFAGEHNISNALAAAAFSIALKVPLKQIVKGLQHAVGAKGRLNFIQRHQYTFIDDTYNANPSSMLAAADVLLKQNGLKVMVIGDIGELGAEAEREHIALGQKLAEKEIDYIVAVGQYSKAIKSGAQALDKIINFETQAHALPALIHMIEKHQPQSMNFLFKGSRFTHMETLMADLMEKL
ncbi:UDP-N-acetylmuramoyl-tripeptide--D-alanyl-D-alanine ligase [Acinetobacter nectaris]|uniref:UDP-N-acetylmuramoyl-tripeptide--D-alanyl-D- alanine ligase n=1 Tax=Acinetobacter nectaris TaxID=1219382 RepID=UPI001EFFD13D|nr:UDP-N-acetylmuramoyl-tripeptide--D-alanyl-D-alanine ligase [Acinetobacter nectaris]MCF9033533.1 UDP-N-acetylmuramoyl-tripeptide--D-alanyl-D-alanine ligase [Acinetobacter nectaris]